VSQNQSSSSPTLQPVDGAATDRVLIANRGEIAIRIAKAAAAVGMESVAVHPPADELSLHTATATTAVALPAGADPVAAYLDIDAVVAAAVDSGCRYVHPGYGFLAENAEFARRCAEAGLVFIGPPGETLALFGDKTAARNLAVSLDIPVIAGSDGALGSADEAAAAADELGYPVMLKAAAGGGGRGMRAVADPSELAEAYARASSEAESAFGDGRLFLEQLVERPRHIEVQILADGQGGVVHLWERDCSVQQRNQKVVEIAPAANLDPTLRQRILDDAVKLITAASSAGGYLGAGTVEFLVAPETGAHYFIECNPRIQVEHTITEQVTGVDLVAAQFRLAGGASLADIGFGSQQDVPDARGFAVQARVVATGPGTITAYKEPAGPGVRVDGCGYAGYTPPSQFDPLLAKVIASSEFTATLESAVDRAVTALDEFHVAGLPTNLAQLRAILARPEVVAGDARTTLLGEHDELGPAANGAGPVAAPGTAGSAIDLLDRQAGALLGPGGGPTAAPVANGPSLDVADDQRGVTCPMDATVLECRVSAGDLVTAGDTLVVVNAMKMETNVTAPAAGTVIDVVDMEPGTVLGAGQVIVVISPGDAGDVGSGPGSGVGSRAPASETWQKMLDDVDTLRGLAHERLAPGSDDPGVVRQRNRGKLTCRERIDLLLDDGSFREVGSVAGFTSRDEYGDIEAFTPANHVGGWGEIEGRTSIVCADDFTSRGGHSDGAIGEKSGYLDRLSIELGIPSIRLLDGSSGGGSVASMVPKQAKSGDSSAKESSGAIKAGRPRVEAGGGSFLPGSLGSTMYARQLTEVPVVNMLLGSVVGLGAAKAVLGHFSVMVRDIAQLFVAGPPVVSHAMGYDITKEELGDWRIHCTNGSVDNLAETEEDAVAQTRRFLSYLPANVFEAPPVLPPRTDDPADRSEEELFTIVPRKRTTTFDIRRVIELMADKGSFFEIGGLWGTDQVTGFVRFNGYPMGVIASDSRHVNGGALTADGCDKLIRHLDLCDLFHIPVLNLIDNPGFAVGIEHEVAGTIRKGGEWMVAFGQVQIPIFTVLMRRSFGVAGNNYATPRSAPTVRVTWPAADVGGIPPEGGIEAAYKRQLAEAEDPVALRAELNARIESARGPIGPMNKFQIEEMIDPRHTRRYICEWAPIAHRHATRADRLNPRALGFRP
jgi:acetyl/propionyl-CoA carboxylase alpha subunit/acetyl-CoA carboxylase carboxyltransferase component